MEMSEPIQATCWMAQLTDGTKLRGGQTNLFNTDVNVSAVPVNALKVFSVSHNTFTDTYFAPWNKWFHDGKPWQGDYPYPQQYLMQDGSTLTVDYDNEAGHLVLTQVYPQ
jgi:hypothetical protein